jgi:hypothetical protein
MQVWNFGIFLVEACARLYESPTASGANVGDITPGIPKYLFIMSNIHYISDLCAQDIKKQFTRKARPEYIFPGRHIEAPAGL